MTDDEKLRALAEAATPGKWTASHYGPSDSAIRDRDGDPVAETFANVSNAHADAAYIAAVHPGAVVALLDRLRAAEADSWEDATTPEDAAIGAAHPLSTGRHDLYNEAMRLVGARRSKAALIELVNWLLAREDVAREALLRAADALEGVLSSDSDMPSHETTWGDASDTLDAVRSALAALPARSTT